MSFYRLTTEIFCLPHTGQFIAYAPLKGHVMLVNAAGADILHRLSEGILETPTVDTMEFISSLMDMGLVNAQPEELHQDGDAEFRPTETTLFLTTSCNLRCSYCYASGGDNPETMSWDVARAAVDLVVENAREAGSASFGLSFHGAGEPTLAWPMIKMATEYAREAGRTHGLKCRCAMASNGVLSDEVLEWIATQVDDVNLSIDGVGEPHDRQRPLASGGPSWPHVQRTLDVLTARGCLYGIRMTATRGNLEHLPEAVAYFVSRGRPRTIHIEPVFQCGRCLHENVEGPSAEDFIAVFRTARTVAEKHGISLYYSGARYPHTGVTFCQAAGGNFTVSSRGVVTACYEVCHASDPRSEMFFYGRYDPVSGRFIFDESRRKRLQSLNVLNVPFCARCFCKYTCSGDCPAKRMASFGEGLPDRVSVRCRITQELTRDQIVSALRKGSLTAEIASREHAMAKETDSRG
jgi:uncharacterized protein